MLIHSIQEDLQHTLLPLQLLHMVRTDIAAQSAPRFLLMRRLLAALPTASGMARGAARQARISAARAVTSTHVRNGHSSVSNNRASSTTGNGGSKVLSRRSTIMRTASCDRSALAASLRLRTLLRHLAHCGRHLRQATIVRGRRRCQRRRRRRTAHTRVSVMTMLTTAMSITRKRPPGSLATDTPARCKAAALACVRATCTVTEQRRPCQLRRLVTSVLHCQAQHTLLARTAGCLGAQTPAQMPRRRSFQCEHRRLLSFVRALAILPVSRALTSLMGLRQGLLSQLMPRCMQAVQR